MKKSLLLISLSLLGLGLKAQLSDPITFELGQEDTAWILFENGAEQADDDVNVVLNPLSSDVNSSDSVLQFIVRDDSKTWVGMYSDNVGFIEFTQDAHVMSMMVLKTVISPLRMKLELSLNGGANTTAIVSNTLTDEWELLNFSLPDAIGYIFQRLTIFPDFPDVRDGGSTVYLDNIANSTPDNTAVKDFSGQKMRIYPNPAEFRMGVEYPGMTALYVSDILGKRVKSMQFGQTNSKVVDISDLSSGIYFVTVETARGNYSMSFMKK